VFGICSGGTSVLSSIAIMTMSYSVWIRTGEKNADWLCMFHKYHR